MAARAPLEEAIRIGGESWDTARKTEGEWGDSPTKKSVRVVVCAPCGIEPKIVKIVGLLKVRRQRDQERGQVQKDKVAAAEGPLPQRAAEGDQEERRSRKRKDGTQVGSVPLRRRQQCV